MRGRKMPKEDSGLAALRLPPELKEAARKRCLAEDLTFSQFMRRAIRRELGDLGESGPTRKGA